MRVGPLASLLASISKVVRLYIIVVMNRLEFLAQHVDGLRPKKPKNNEFVEVWVRKLGFSWSNNDLDRLDDKNLKMDHYKMKKERPRRNPRTIVLI